MSGAMQMIRRGDVLWIRCDPSVGVEPKKTRTCVVISNDKANAVASTVTVVPTLAWSTERASRYYMIDLRPPRSTLVDARVANCSHISTYDKGRIVRHAGTVSPQALGEIEEALRQYLGMIPDSFEVHERELAYRIEQSAARLGG